MKTPTYSQFVLRRLHSLTGVVPLTFFIIFHFYANAKSTVGEQAFDDMVAVLRGMPFLLAVEWGLLFAPFLFHMIYGMVIIFSAKANVGRLPFRRNWAFVLQRITAMIVFTFIIYHVVGIRFVDGHGVDNMYALLHKKLSNPFSYWWYVIGVVCTSFHLANGLCTFLMTWGITVGKKAQKGAEVVMGGLGVVICAIGIAALNGFLAVPPQKEPVKVTHASTAEALTENPSPSVEN